MDGVVLRQISHENKENQGESFVIKQRFLYKIQTIQKQLSYTGPLKTVLKHIWDLLKKLKHARNMMDTH